MSLFPIEPVTKTSCSYLSTNPRFDDVLRLGEGK